MQFSVDSPEAQVEASHYEFSGYMNKRRWASFWHQIDEILKRAPRSVLEIGKGTGLLGAVLRKYDIEYESVDSNADLSPDIVASVTSMPLEDRSYDLVACFQILEHLPYTEFPAAISEVARVASKDVILSLPDARVLWPWSIYLPSVGRLNIQIPKPMIRPRKHEFDGQHYWEINKAEYPLERVAQDMHDNGLDVRETYRVPEHPYHRYFICRVKGE
jgi:SAM-dependent methyltransferase